QRDHDHRGAYDTGRRRQNRAHCNYSDRQPSWYPSKEHLQAPQQFASDSAVGHDRAHENKHRHGNKNEVLGNPAEYAAGQDEEAGERKYAEPIANEAKHQSDAAQYEGDWKA